MPPRGVIREQHGKLRGILLTAILEFVRNLRFRQKLFLSYLIVIIIPLIVLGSYSYYQSKELLLQQARNSLEDSVRQMAVGLNYKFMLYNSAIESIIYNPSVISIFDTEYANYYFLYEDLSGIVDPLFRTISLMNEDIQQITIYTGNENITERRNSILHMNRIASEPWFEEAKDSPRTLWFYRDGELFGVRSVVGARRNAIRNMIYLQLNYDRIFGELGNAADPSGVLSIRDQRGELLYTKGDADAHDDADGGVLRIEHAIPGSEWTIHYTVPASDVAVNAQTIVRAAVIIVGACLVILLCITWFFSATFVRRIYKLNRNMKLVSHGNLNIRIASDSRDEIGELTNRFGEMLRSINSLIGEVYQSKIVQKEAQLKALQAQINPHFLYNSLSLINWKAIEIGAEDISQITTTLSQFYRTTLNKGNDVISIKDEVENTRAYIELQLIMHNGRFDYAEQLDERIFDFKMIKLILQPIVENAIEHGIDQKRSGRGELRLGARLLADAIEFTVTDNGPGMDERLAEEVLRHKSSGYGLYNANERLKMFFGEPYGIRVQSTVGVGTTVTVTIPRFQQQLMHSGGTIHEQCT